LVVDGIDVSRIEDGVSGAQQLDFNAPVDLTT